MMVKTISLLFLLGLISANISGQERKPEIILQTGHVSQINTVAFSPDGKTLASGSSDKTLKIWDFAAGQQIRTIKTDANVTIFSPDGNTLASAESYGSTVKLWSVKTGDEIEMFEGEGMTATGIAFSPDGKIIAVSYLAGDVTLWNAVSGEKIRTFKAHSDNANAVAFSPDGKQFATAGSDKTAKIWNTISGKEVKTLKGHAASVKAVTFSPDGKTIASADDNKTIKIWNAVSGDALKTINGLSNVGRTLNFSPDGKMLLAASDDANKLKLWDAVTGAEVKSIASKTAGTYDFIYSSAFSPDGRTIAAVGMFNTVRLFDAATGEQTNNLTGQTEDVRSLALSADGKTLVVGGYETVKSWNFAAGEKLNTFNGYKSTFYRATAISPDGKTTASSDGTFDYYIKLSETDSGRELNVLKGHTDDIQSIAFAPDGKTLASASRDKTIKLWDAVTGRELKTFQGHKDYVYAVAFAPDGKTLVSGGKENGVKLWNVDSGSLLKSIKAPIDEVETVAFSLDGKKIAFNSRQLVMLWNLETDKEIKSFYSYSSAGSLFFAQNGDLRISRSWDDSLKMWDAFSGNEIKSVDGANGELNNAVFSPDGRYIALIEEKNVNLREANSKKEMILTGHSDKVNSVAFSPDGKILMTASNDSTVKLWNVENGKEIKTFKGESAIYAAALSADGKMIAAGQYHASYQLWNIETGAEIKNFKGLETDISSILSIAFAPDGKSLAIGDSDGSVKLSEIESGGELKNFKASDGLRITAVAFAPDGKSLASGDGEETVKIWDTATGQKLRSLKMSVPNVHREIFDAVPDFYRKNASSQTTADGKFQFRADEAGKIELYEARTGKLLANLIAFGGEDWAVVTPDGLFDGTAAGWGKMLWRLENDTFRRAPVEAFFKEFYYPNLLQDIMAGRILPAVKDLSRIDIRQPILKITEINGKPANPGTDLWADNPLVKIRVEITDNSEKGRQADFPPSSGANDVRLFRGGSLIKLWRKSAFELTEKDGCRQLAATREAPRKAVCETEARITEGMNDFSAYAFNHDNVKSNDAAAKIEGAGILKKSGTLYVLAVGINEYQNAANNLNFAVADADSVTAEIAAEQSKLQTAQYEQTNVIKLTNADATRANILAALRKFSGAGQTISNAKLSSSAAAELAKIKFAEPEDAIIIYYAGHGTARCQKTVNGQNDCDRFYLIPHDGFPAAKINDEDFYAAVYRNSISDEDLEAAFETIDAGKLLLVIDACNSGQALEAAEKRRGPMNSRGLAQLAYEKGIYILAAAQSQQAALEAVNIGGKEIKHGLLTYALLQGLTDSGADKDNNKQLWEREWLDYAVEQVPQMQLEAMKQRHVEIEKTGRGVEIIYSNDDKKNTNPNDRRVQTPRVFYRRETEINPLVVAKP